MKLSEAARAKYAPYYRVYRRSRGLLASNTRRGTNKKLVVPQSNALKDYLLIYSMLGKPTAINDVIAAVNSILRIKGVVDE